MTCGACGADLQPGAVFCVKCGTRVPPRGWDEVDELTHTVTRQGLAGQFAPPSAEQRVNARAVPPMRRGSDTETVEVELEPEDLSRMWWVLLPDGTRSDVVIPLLLGRRPTHGPGTEGHRLLTVPDYEGTVSRNHAIVEPSSAAVKVTNLSSKNTIQVEWPDGVRYAIQPGQFLVITNPCVLKLGTATLLLQHS